MEHAADGPEFNTANATPVTEMTLIAVEACSDPTVNDIVILTEVEDATYEDNVIEEETRRLTIVRGKVPVVDAGVGNAAPATTN